MALTTRRERREHGWTRLSVDTNSRDCPDCLTDTETLRASHGGILVNVAHDDTCPWWRARYGTDRRPRVRFIVL